MGSFPVVYGNNCQNQCVTPKTFDSYAYNNISWYIRYRTIMVAFRNKWSWGAPRDPSIRLYQEIGRFSIVYGNNCQNQSVTPKIFVLMPTKTFPGTYGIELLWWHSITNCFGDPTGCKHMDISRNGKIFLWCSSATAKIEVLHQKLLTRMGTRNC